MKSETLFQVSHWDSTELHPLRSETGENWFRLYTVSTHLHYAVCRHTNQNVGKQLRRSVKPSRPHSVAPRSNGWLSRALRDSESCRDTTELDDVHFRTHASARNPLEYPLESLCFGHFNLNSFL